MPFNKDAMKAVGFSDSEISAAADMIRARMVENGNSEDQIKEYFDIRDVPPIEPIAEHFAQQARRGNPVKGEEPVDADSWTEVFKQGAKNSIWGAAVGEQPKGLPEDASFAKKLVQGAESTILDLPVIAAASLTPAGPIGGFAATEAARAALIQMYKKGVSNAGDAMDLIEATAHGLIKGTILGKAGEVGGKLGAEKIGKLASSFGAESIGGFFGGATGSAVAMTAAGGAVEGHVPTADEFLSNAILGTAFHAHSTAKQFQAEIEASSSSLEGYKNAKAEQLFQQLQNRIDQRKAKLENIYIKTGISPTELETMASKDPVLGQQLSSENVGIPDAIADKKQATVKSDFVYENGKLHRGDSEEALAYLKPKKVTYDELEQELSFTHDDIESAARLHDPETFKKLEQQNSRMEVSQKQIEKNQEEIATLKEAADRADKLELIRKRLDAGDYKNQDEFYALTEEEKQLRPTEGKDRKARDRVEQLHQENIDVSEATVQAHDDTLEQKVMRAMALGEKTVRETKKDIARNRYVEDYDANDPFQNEFPWVDKDFIEDSHVTPKSNEEYQMHLIEQLDEIPAMDRNSIKAQLAKSFKTSFNVVENEAPTYYHGTNSEFTDFNPELGATAGSWFTTDKNEAAKFGKVKEVHLSFKNPASQMDFLKARQLAASRGFDMNHDSVAMNKEVIKILKEQGFDSIKAGKNENFKGAGGKTGEVVAVLSSDQIKLKQPSKNGNLEILPRVKPSTDWKGVDAYKNFFKNVIKGFYSEDIQAYLAQKNIQKTKNLKFSERAYDRAIQSNDTTRTAAYFIEKGIFDPKTGAQTSEGLASIMERVPKEKIDDFRKFILYRHGLDISSKGGYVSDTFNDAIARKFVKDHPEFAQVHDDLVKWNNALLDYEVKAGTLGAEEAARAIAEHPYYTPMKRVNEDTTPKNSRAARALQVRRGSDLPFLDPLTAMADKAINTAKRVADNEAAKSVVAMDKASEGQILHFSRNANPGEKLSPNEIGYYDNGQYKIAAFKDAELAETFNTTGGQLFKLHPLMKAALAIPRAASSILRGGISIGFDFATSHNIRNIMNAYVLGGDKAFVDHWKGLSPSRLKEVIKGESPLYLEADKAGAFTGVIKNVDDMAAKYEFSLQQDKSLLTRGTNTVKNVWTVAHEVMRVVAEAQRLEMYSRAKKEGSLDTFEAQKEAGWDIARMQTSGLNKGVYSEVLNAFIPFLHYENNGLLRYGEAWYEDPKRQATRTGMMASVSALTWYLTKDDEYYKTQVPDYEKYAYWHVGYDGHYLKIAKPWTAGRLASAVGSGILDTLYNRDPESVKKAFEAVFESIPKPSTDKIALNSFYKMMVENKDTLTNRNIISEYQKKVYPTLQRNSFTTATGIKIAETLNGIANGIDGFMHTDAASKAVNATHLNSPIMVDKIIQVFAGANGAKLLRAMESISKSSGILNEDSGQSITPQEFFSQPFWKIAPDLPVIGALIHREAIYNAQVLKDFDDKFTSLKEAHTQYANAEALLSDPEQSDKAAKVMNLLEEKHPELKMWDRIQESKNAMLNQQKLSYEILADRNMRKVERVQAAEDVYKSNIATAKSILEEMKDYAHTQN